MADRHKGFQFPRTLGLAFMQAIGWMYFSVFLQLLVYGGGQGHGEDLGLGTFIPGMAVALAWSCVISLAVNRALVGRKNWPGAVAGGILGGPIWVVLCFALDPIYIPNTRPSLAAEIFAPMFSVLGLGILPEGRRFWGGAHALGFVVIFMVSIFGLAVGSYRRKE
jgi:hypothetical protein